MMKRKVLLTGASGTVGFEVLKQLIEKDEYQIIVFDVENQNSKKKFASLPQKFETIFGDISKVSDVENLPKKLDYIIHLAAIIPPLADENTALAERVNLAGTQYLVQYLEQTSPNAFLIYSSSISVYGDRLKNPDIKVGDPLAPSEGDHYAETKIKAEEIIQKSSLDWTIFRLAAIMGNHKISKLMFHMPLDTAMEICTPSDTARAFVNAIDKRENLNKKIFNLGGGSRCRTSYREFLSRSFSIFGLGNLDFPHKAFAEKNFHCGYYTDGDDLEEIVHFRRDSLEDYFREVREKINPITKFFTRIASPFAKKFLLKQSEPYHAFRNNDIQMMKRFFN